MPGLFIGFFLLICIGVLVVRNIQVVPQAHSYVVERMGSYLTTWENGLHLKIPFIDRVAKKVTLMEQVADFPPQDIITKDNVSMKVDTVIFYQIMDPKLYTYGVTNPMLAIANLTATTLRNIIGNLELDETLTSRERINSEMCSTLDEATDVWGIKVTRVEIKNLIPPADIQASMEKQMKAERERRETLLKAEGQKKSSILVAEGEKESAILRADADKEAKIRAAEAEAEARIRIAEAEATAIRMVNEANAEAIERLKAAAPSKEVLTLESFKTMEKVANGQATKIIIPSELQGSVGAFTAIAETLKK